MAGLAGLTEAAVLATEAQAKEVVAKAEAVEEMEVVEAVAMAVAQ